MTMMTKTNQGSGEDKEAHWKHRNAKDDWKKNILSMIIMVMMVIIDNDHKSWLITIKNIIIQWC